ncbi:hypothetical protein MA16_Dca020276 [Dendrobium catenatum]|uniref:Uncharacterized protein n=1 Tax=Dendrobium catenatum TaxID=906689 RepID=A0A2I0X477_9ASPA|nr:hypothetical protein MA16_Dca020276 [Dendrobium catenatum]
MGASIAVISSKWRRYGRNKLIFDGTQTIVNSLSTFTSSYGQFIHLLLLLWILNKVFLDHTQTIANSLSTFSSTSTHLFGRGSNRRRWRFWIMDLALKRRGVTPSERKLEQRELRRRIAPSEREFK